MDRMKAQNIAGIDFQQDPLWHQFLNFNYTSIFDQLLSESANLFIEHSGLFNFSDSNGAILHVHGSLQDTPACGPESISQIANPSFRKDETIIKSITKKGIMESTGQIADQYGLQAIDDADIICIFGMSLGVCDGRWWRKIKERLSANEKCILIYFDHSLRQQYSAPLDRNRSTESARNKIINSFGNCGLEINSMLSDRIFVAPSEKIFPIQSPRNYAGVSDDELHEIADELFSHSDYQHPSL